MNRFSVYALATGLLVLAVPGAAWARGGNDALGVGVGVVVGVIIVFLLAREFVCWYNKTNEHGAVLREIRDELRALRVGGGHALVEPEEKEYPIHPDDAEGDDEPADKDAWS